MTEWPVESVLKVLEIVSILGGGGTVAYRLGRTTERVEQTLANQNILLAQQSDEIRALKDETKKWNEVLTQIALQKRDIELLNDRYEELRHGEGFVHPLMMSKQRSAP